MGCGSSSTANLAEIKELEPLLVLPSTSTTTPDDVVSFTFGPIYKQHTTKVHTIQVDIASPTANLTMFIECSSRALILKDHRNGNVVAVAKKIGPTFNIYKLTQVYDGQKHDNYAKYVDNNNNKSKLYKYGALSNTNIFSYVAGGQNAGYYHVLKTDLFDGKFECKVSKTVVVVVGNSGGNKKRHTNLMKWIHKDNNTHQVTVFKSNREDKNDTSNRIDIGLMVNTHHCYSSFSFFCLFIYFFVFIFSFLLLFFLQLCSSPRLFISYV